MEPNGKVAWLHLLLAGLLVTISLLVVFLGFRDISWNDPYFAAVRTGVMLLLVPPAALNGLIAWGAWRKAAWARIASIAVAVLLMVFACFCFIGMVSDPVPQPGSTIFMIVLGGAAGAAGAYLLANRRWD